MDQLTPRKDKKDYGCVLENPTILSGKKAIEVDQKLKEISQTISKLCGRFHHIKAGYRETSPVKTVPRTMCVPPCLVVRAGVTCAILQIMQ